MTTYFSSGIDLRDDWSVGSGEVEGLDGSDTPTTAALPTGRSERHHSDQGTSGFCKGVYNFTGATELGFSLIVFSSGDDRASIEEQDEDAREMGAEDTERDSASALRRLARLLMVLMARAESRAKCVREAIASMRVGGCNSVVNAVIDLAPARLVSLKSKGFMNKRIRRTASSTYSVGRAQPPRTDIASA